MVKIYSAFILTIFLLVSGMLCAQEIKIFKVDDFDLSGPVQSCLVSTKYGKEEYDFNEEGLLTKSVTRYNDNDYDITYYSYTKGFLQEKRFEIYRDKIFDPASSIANIYTLDTTVHTKVTEKIISYEKEFLDQYEYFYTDDTIRRIIRTNNEGIDETLVSYTQFKGESTKTYELNGVSKESIRSSVKKVKDSIVAKTVLTKKFMEGQPHTALEEVFDGRNALVLKTDFVYDTRAKQFVKQGTETYTYDDSGMLLSTQSETGEVLEKKEYIYQLDPNGNWIKEIITPDNTYTTRSITYYESEEEVQGN